MIMLPDKFSNVESLRPGKSAEVFKAVNDITGRTVFLKQYSLSKLDANSALAEPRLLTELEHENLIKIYSADIIAGNHILLEMEYANGGSIKDFISSAGRNFDWPSVHECIHLITDVAAGLAHLGDRGFVHRDVKPANLVIRYNEAGTHAAVADLGLVAKLDSSGRAFATKHSRVYRPPEVWQGNGYSRRSDIYQLGMVLFEMLGGQVDHKMANLDDGQLASLAANSKILSLDSLTADVGPALRKVLAKSLASEARRHPTMQDLMLDLAKAKKRDPDWKFRRTESGFILSREDRGFFYRVEVDQGVNASTIKRYKGKNQSRLRKINPDQTFITKNLEVYKPFRECLVW